MGTGSGALLEESRVEGEREVESKRLGVRIVVGRNSEDDVGHVGSGS